MRHRFLSCALDCCCGTCRALVTAGPEVAWNSTSTVHVVRGGLGLCSQLFTSLWERHKVWEAHWQKGGTFKDCSALED